MKDDEIVDWLHIKIHALRMMEKYAPSIFEQQLNKLIAEEFANSCAECKDKVHELKYKPIEQKKGFMAGIFK